MTEALKARPWDPDKAARDLANRDALGRSGIRVCEGCGCTENNACCRLPDGSTTLGCYWISPTRCSQCPPDS